MDCPYCGKEMREGKIPCRDQLRWYDSGNGDIWGEGVPLCETFKDAQAFFCPECRRIVMPVPEVEGIWNKMRRKIEAASEKAEALQKQWETRRAQEKDRKKKEKFGSKDPWEL